MRKLSVKFQHVFSSDKSGAGTESPWLTVVQMNNLHGRCDAAFEKTRVPTSISDSSPT